jgi:hypothetical protein
MAWTGWFQYDGNEIVNVTRTEAYAKALGLRWLKPVFNNDSLPYLLDDAAYRTPVLDEAPWTDDDRPESFDFCGIYPLDVTGIEDSTRGSEVVQSVRDGGEPGRLRHGTKAFVFNTVLISASEDGAEYGFRWLKQALLGSACSNEMIPGGDLCYLSSAPEVILSESTEEVLVYDGGKPSLTGPAIDGGTASTTGAPLAATMGGDIVLADPSCFDSYYRSLRRVVFNEGPTITGKRSTQDGGAVWSVTFTGVAGSPYEFGAENPIVAGFCKPGVNDPYLITNGGAFNVTGSLALETPCAVPVYAPIYDPLCPAITAPPGPPSVPLGCFTPPQNWTRRFFTIPKDQVPLWGEVAPVVSVHANRGVLRNLRLRFYADVLGDGAISEDPCNYCGDILISYVPQNASLIFDASDQVVYIEQTGGVRRRADSLVFKTDGTPFDWPALTCGFSYVVTVDLPQTQIPPSIDLLLVPRAL